jgi:hypothetical protein
MLEAEHVAYVLGDPQREGNSWLCRCPVHGGRSLILSNARDGTLLWNCKKGCSQEEIKEELVYLGLYEKAKSFWTFTRPPARVPDAADKSKYARKIWRQASPIEGTLADEYLSERGYSGPLYKSLRFHPDLWHKPSHKSWPALIAKVVRDREIIGIHRTWLDRWSPKKAPLGEQVKMALGSVKGGAVRLGKANDKLLIGEGIETTLCTMQFAKCPGWAVLGSWNFEFVQIPTVNTVIIAADHDELDTAMVKARLLRRRLVRQGVTRCHVVTPPEPGTDWADIARELQ